ncbi:acyl-CoA dehydrogenase [Sulfolobales archaeon HS-7]|nr:acyl-CoA dehydrogenase [Sulfolobales archaeon HS-7]
MIPFRDFKVDISEEHEILRSTIKDFCESEVTKYVEEGELKGEIPAELKAKVVKLGLYGLNAKPELGGQGGDLLSQAIASEELSRVWTSFSTHLFINWLYIHAVQTYGSGRIAEKYVPPVAKGQKIGAFANTEPGAGSDVAGIKTYAKKVGNEYVINGRKIFISNGGIADYIVVSARTSPPEEGKRWKGISLFIVEKEQVKIISRIDTVGLRASNTAELSFEDAEVPEENMIGEEGMGFKHTLEAFDYSRVVVAAQGVGLAQAALEKMITYSMSRTAFDRKIAEFQLIQEKVAESIAEVAYARLLTYWAANLIMKGNMDDGIPAASIAKYVATDVANRVAQRAENVMGGYGVSKGGAERYLRDAQILMTYEGTNDIQKLTVARTIYRKLGLRI